MRGCVSLQKGSILLLTSPQRGYRNLKIARLALPWTKWAWGRAGSFCSLGAPVCLGLMMSKMLLPLRKLAQLMAEQACRGTGLGGRGNVWTIASLSDWCLLPCNVLSRCARRHKMVGDHWSDFILCLLCMHNDNAKSAVLYCLLIFGSYGSCPSLFSLIKWRFW